MEKSYKCYSIIILALIFVSCNRRFLSSTNTRDSIRVEYVETVRNVEVKIPVPYEVLVNVTRDTTSFLQTSLAESSVWWVDGLLHHSIRNRPENAPVVTIPVVDIKEKEYRDRKVIKNIPYPVKIPLTWWQKFRMDTGGWAIGVLVLGGGAWVLKKFVFK